MWLSYDKDYRYELWATKPKWEHEHDEFVNSNDDSGSVFDFCVEEFEKALPRLKLKHREIRRISVKPLGRKQKV